MTSKQTMNTINDPNIDREYMKCMCDWSPGSCAMVYNSVPIGHKWHGPPIQFRDTISEKRSTLIKSLAFREGLYHHFHVDEEERDKLDATKKLRICKHHFPEQLLNQKTRTTRLITKKEVKDFGLERLSEKCNLVSQLMKNTKSPLNLGELSTYSGLYVQVPIISEKEAGAFLQNLNSARANRAPPELTPTKDPVTPKPIKRSVADIGDVNTDNVSTYYMEPKKKKKINELDHHDDDDDDDEQRNHFSVSYAEDGEDNYNSIENINNIFVSYYIKANQNEEEFRKYIMVQRAIHDVKFAAYVYPAYPLIWNLSKTKVLHICHPNQRSDECVFFSLRDKNVGERLCESCEKLQISIRKQEVLRSQSTSGDKTKANSRTNFCHLSPNSKAERCSSQAKSIRQQKQVLERYKLELRDARDDQLIKIDDENADIMLKEILTKAGKNSADLKHKIIQVLVNSEKLKENWELDETKLQAFASRVCTLMADECKKLSGKKNLIQYDTRMKRIALAYWLETGKTGLNKLRERSLEIIP